MRGRVWMVVHHYYPRDVRVRREARALVAAGLDVTVVALRGDSEPAEDEVEGVRVLRMPVARHRGRPLAVYLAEYLAMTALAAKTVLARARGADVIHVHTPPDFLAAAALPAFLGRAKLVLDIHDLSPELYGSRFGGRGAALLALAESGAAALADRVITVTDVFAARLVARGVPAQKLTVLRNCPDEGLFDPARRRPLDGGPFSIVHAGTLVHRYGIDVLLEAFARARPRLGDARLTLIGEGDLVPALERRAAEADLKGAVVFRPDAHQEVVAEALTEADLAVVPNRSDPFTDLLLPTKLLEALRMGCPAIASATPVVREAFREDELVLVPPGDPEALAEAIVALARDPARRAALAEGGLRAAGRFSWAAEKTRLLDLYRGLLG